MNLRLTLVYVRTPRSGRRVGPRLVATRGQEREKEKKRSEETKREKERRGQGRCLDNSCKVQLAGMPATSGEEDKGMQEGEKGQLKGSTWRVQGDEKKRRWGEKERGLAPHRREKESVRITSATGPHKGASERTKEEGLEGLGRVMLSA